MKGASPYDSLSYVLAVLVGFPLYLILAKLQKRRSVSVLAACFF